MPLPESLSDQVTVLRDGTRTIYVVGTAHVSQQSVEDVEQVIDAVRPDTVCVELCEARYLALTDADRWKNLDVFQVIRSGKTLFLLANLAIGAYQRRIGRELGVQPGAEMLAAARLAETQGAELALIDRDIHVTLRRTWANLSFFQKMALLGAILQSFLPGEEISRESIEALKEQGNLDHMLEEFARAFPAVKGPLIDERDQYMTAHLQQVEGETIVAVVGAAHVPGMRRLFDAPQERESISTMPPPSRAGSLLKWGIPAIIVAAFWFGLTGEEPRSFQELFYAWVLPNSIAAGVLTLAAGGKAVSVLAAIIGSPLTSLNPLLNTGLVVGLTDAWARKPTVEDAGRIHEDVQTLRGFYRNRFTRVLLVAAAATIGSALGAWIGMAWVVGLVAS